MTCYRQGDVALVRIDGIPENFGPVDIKDGKIILASGEATGHHHRIEFAFDAPDHPKLYRDIQTGAQILEVGGGSAALLHEEHDPITLRPGRYLQLVQVEDDGEMVRQVAD